MKADLDDAQRVVDSIGASKNYWYRVRKSRYNAWRSAISRTNRAPWWQYAYYKGAEASKYASYVAAAGTYSAQVVAHNAAKVTYNVVRDAAGWALDTAGVDANPEVVRINILLAAANLAVDAADSVLDEVERINSDALQYLTIADSLRVDRITLAGNLANFGSAGVSARIDASFAGNSFSLALHASTENLVEQLANDLATAIL